MKKSTKKEIIKILIAIIYVIGMIFLVRYLKMRAEQDVSFVALSNAIFDLFAISVGFILIIFVPIYATSEPYKAIYLNYFLFAVTLSFAIYLKYGTVDGNIIADLLYVFSGATFLQATKTLRILIENKKIIKRNRN